MGISGKKVAVLVDDYFEQAEFEEPIDALREAGAEVQVIAVKNRLLHGLNHIDKGDIFKADLLLHDTTPDDYDALVLPGGVVNADSLRMVEAAQLWVRDFLEEEKPVAVICHAPWVLVSADLIDGRRLTSYETIQDDVQNAGGDWVDQPVVIDGNLITSRKPDDLPAFNEALITMLKIDLPNDTADAIESSSSESAEPALDARATDDEARLRALGYDKRRDGINSAADEQDILDEEDSDEYDDTDVLHLSSVVPPDEQDNDQ